MIIHYLKIAFRNLLKYKTQSFISIIGLAVGFVCFTFSALWIHSERRYDRYHEGAERMYLFYKKSITDYNGYDTKIRNQLSTLREKFPEVEMACGINFWKNQETEIDDGKKVSICKLIADSTFMEMFGIKILAGTPNFLWSVADERQRHFYDDDEPVAITEEAALRLYGTTAVIGKKLKSFGQATICAVVTGLPQSSLSFDLWGGSRYSEYISNPLVFRLRKGANLQRFRQKLDRYKTILDGKSVTPFKEYQFIPLSEFHYSDANKDRSIKFNYLILFTIIGLMVILGALFNYLSLFVVRMRMRSREIELRQVCGSGKGRLFLLFGIEYTLVILLAGVLGCSLSEIASAEFRAISGMQGDLYLPFLFFFAGILLLSLLLLFPFITQRKRWDVVRSRTFRRFSILFQIATSVLFIFSATVIMKQLHFLTHADLGWERKNIASLHVTKMKPRGEHFDYFHEVARCLAAMPCVNLVIENHTGLLAGHFWGTHSIDDWEGKTLDDPSLPIDLFFEGEEFVRFYNLQLKEGRMMNDTDPWYVVLNETAVQKMNLSNPIGQQIVLDSHPTEIVGILKDFHVTAPTVPVHPMAFIGKSGKELNPATIHTGMFMMKFKEGQWEDLVSRIKEMAKELDIQTYKLEKTEDVYVVYLKSEFLLLRMLGMAAIVCIVIAAFGIFSLVTLSCEQRRKEIAVRKVNGATVKDIMLMFIKEYLSMLIAASILAFPIGYLFMKRWIENYMEQTTIGIWIYMLIFASIAIIIAFSISWRVWQAANENPAEVIKSE
ncbi:FtsX-like permease family protein [Bacteroides sp.]|uniref:ABC transporter permease n=1 Tax=Bacteroides sp. TaxID=29523 RepID=UPI0023BDBFD6|nr:FtsX-like permease family protein [Bacteroides sp.]MDE6216746.1 ABC transporter permease [Bacteroides sp.]